MSDAGNVDQRQFERTPEFYAAIEHKADRAAGQLVNLLTREEVIAYVKALIALNEILRVQLAEQNAALTVVCLGTKEQYEQRRGMEGS